jgi:hypothetical protein
MSSIHLHICCVDSAVTVNRSISSITNEAVSITILESRNKILQSTGGIGFLLLFNFAKHHSDF